MQNDDLVECGMVSTIGSVVDVESKLIVVVVRRGSKSSSKRCRGRLYTKQFRVANRFSAWVFRIGSAATKLSFADGECVIREKVKTVQLSIRR